MSSDLLKKEKVMWHFILTSIAEQMQGIHKSSETEWHNSTKFYFQVSLDIRKTQRW